MGTRLALNTVMVQDQDQVMRVAIVMQEGMGVDQEMERRMVMNSGLMRLDVAYLERVLVLDMVMVMELGLVKEEVIALVGDGEAL
jgi:hypothetical protein